jgi:hypothetical protein
MKKIILSGLLLLSAGLIFSAEEGETILKWNELEVQTINFENQVLIKDGRVLRKGNYYQGKFVEKSKEEIISEDDKKLCTKNECIVIDNNSLPIIKTNHKEVRGSWSFGPAKLKLERAMTINKK